MPEHTVASRLRLSGLCFLLQILTIILFAVFVRYSPESSSGLCSQQLNCSWRNQDSGFQHRREYPPPRVGAEGGSAWFPGVAEGVARDVTVLSPSSRAVTPSSSGSDSRVEQRRGKIKPQGWGTGASHRGGVSGWKADALRRYPTCLDKARPKTGIFGSRI